MPSAKVRKKQGRNATAIHAKTKDGVAHIVGIGSLRVMITNDDGSWFAQALELDYAAQADSLEAVKKSFEQGLMATIDEHIRVFGSIDKLLRPAPPEVWAELVSGAALAKRYSQVSVHMRQLGLFDQIDYFEPRAA